jgi:hypothetical protein
MVEQHRGSWLLSLISTSTEPPQDRFGIGFVSGVPATLEATEELTTRIGFIRETQCTRHLALAWRAPDNVIDGKFWEFTSDLTKGDTAYTTLALGAHTDNTYFVRMPAWNRSALSHCYVDRPCRTPALPPSFAHRRLGWRDTARRWLPRRLDPEGRAPAGVRAPVPCLRPRACGGRGGLDLHAVAVHGVPGTVARHTRCTRAGQVEQRRPERHVRAEA